MFLIAAYCILIEHMPPKERLHACKVCIVQMMPIKGKIKAPSNKANIDEVRDVR